MEVLSECMSESKVSALATLRAGIIYVAWRTRAAVGDGMLRCRSPLLVDIFPGPIGLHSQNLKLKENMS